MIGGQGTLYPTLFLAREETRMKERSPQQVAEAIFPWRTISNGCIRRRMRKMAREMGRRACASEKKLALAVLSIV